MKTKFDSFNAWLRSLPIALVLPPVVWIILWVVFSPQELTRLNPSDIMGGLFIVGVTMLVHFVAYGVTGLPIFFHQYREVSSPVWNPRIGIPIGAILGALAVGGLFGLPWGLGQPFQPSLYLMGAGYGTATAIAALIQRPTRQ